MSLLLIKQIDHKQQSDSITNMSKQIRNNLQIHFENRKLQLKSQYPGIITNQKQKANKYTNCFKSSQGLIESKKYQYQNYNEKRSKSIVQTINEVMRISKQQFINCQQIEDKELAMKSIFTDLMGRNKFNNMQIQSFISDSQYFQQVIAHNDTSKFYNYNQQQAKKINPQNESLQIQYKNRNVFKRQIKFPKIQKNIINSKLTQDESTIKIKYKDISFSNENQLRFSILNTEENHFKSKDIFSSRLLIKNSGINQINANIKNCIQSSKANLILDLMARAASMHNLKLNLNQKVSQLTKSKLKHSIHPHRKLNNDSHRQSLPQKKLQPTLISKGIKYNFEYNIISQELKRMQISNQTDQMNKKKDNFYSNKNLFI